MAILDVKAGREVEFEAVFGEAQAILVRQDGYVSHQLQKCLEIQTRYLLLVNWATLEHHTEGFRGSQAYQKWRRLLHHFYQPFPEVEHYSVVYATQGR